MLAPWRIIAKKKCRRAQHHSKPLPISATGIKSNEDEAHAFLEQLRRRRSVEILQDPNTAKTFATSPFPTSKPIRVSDAPDVAGVDATRSVGAERDQIIEIATLLLPWCRDGNYGPLVRRREQLSLTGKIAHFELGYIPNRRRN
jgi:hypothetical protein